MTYPSHEEQKEGIAMKGFMNMVGLVGMAGFIMSVGLSPVLADETTWQKNHPRRAEVNKRLEPE